jgi:hypothetical protein
MDKVKTGDASKALLIMEGKTRIWLNKNTEFEITDPGKDSMFSLFVGWIKVNANLGKSGRKFAIKTPVSVASVRGTFWNQMHSQSGGTSILVGSGQVAVQSTNLLPAVGGQILQSEPILVRGGFTVAVDQSGAVSPLHETTREEILETERGWEGSEDLEQGSTGGTQGRDLAELRNDLRQTINEIKTDVTLSREVTNSVKEADIATGRTLRDVNGNLVRVEQYLLRPDNKTFQILNLTKRQEYNYTDRNHWGFTVQNKPRLDIADIKITMNQNLPEQLTEWPSFISSKGDKLHPDSVNVSFTNQTDTMEMKGTWGLKGVDLDEKGVLLKDDRVVMKNYINGWAIDAAYQGGKGTSFPKDGSDATELNAWDISPLQRLTKTGQADKFVYIYSEAYGINNDGKILSLNDFTSSSENPFIALKQVAAESIIFVRNADTQRTSFLNAGNLDLITTPDMVISIAEKLGSQIGDITKK